MRRQHYRFVSTTTTLFQIAQKYMEHKDIVWVLKKAFFGARSENSVKSLWWYMIVGFRQLDNVTIEIDVPDYKVFSRLRPHVLLILAHHCWSIFDAWPPEILAFRDF